MVGMKTSGANVSFGTIILAMATNFGGLPEFSRRVTSQSARWAFNGGG